jgi:dethiobiotin synthetase
MKTIFVAGTDTGVGKSLITGLLARQFTLAGKRVVTQKWVETGRTGFSKDIDIHLKLMNKTRRDYAGYLNEMTPYVFKFSASPHLAASVEKRPVNIDRIKRSFKYLSRHFDITIVEGSGGLLVPINRRTLLIDVVRELNMPVLLVAGNRLGAINHTLLSIEALKARHMKILGVVFNAVSEYRNKTIIKDNPKIVKNFLNVDILGSLPYTRNRPALYRRFNQLGKRIAAIS